MKNHSLRVKNYADKIHKVKVESWEKDHMDRMAKEMPSSYRAKMSRSMLCSSSPKATKK